MAGLFNLIFILLAVGFTSCRRLEHPIRLSEPYHVHPYSRTRFLNSESSVVPGFRNCGGSGRLINHRFDLCDANLLPPRTTPVNTDGRLEVIFIPHEDIKGLGVRTTVTTLDDGQAKVYESPLPEADLIAGQEYAIYCAGAATPELKGRVHTFKVEFYRLIDRHVEICYEGDFLGV